LPQQIKSRIVSARSRVRCSADALHIKLFTRILSFALKRVRCWTGQTPGQTRRRIIKGDRAIYAALRHGFYDYGAEPALLRRRYGRAIALGPAHGESVAHDAPRDIDAAQIDRECPVFSGVGGEFVERETDGLRRSWLQAQPGAVHDETRTNKIGEVGQLGVGQILDIDSVELPLHGWELGAVSSTAG
jgi:hypothetical protein